MRASVIIPSYQAPHELDLCLAGIARQSSTPLEVVVADDGSDQSTKSVIEQWQGKLGCELIHVWHPDQGNRKAEICNQAVRESSGELLVFIDGDSIPHSRWIHDHQAAAEDAEVCCGRRVKLGPRITPTITLKMVEKGVLEKLFGPVTWSALCGDTSRLGLGVRLPKLVARMLHPRQRKLMGVNFSVLRDALYRVNGYDQEWSHRRQDMDLDLRLRRGGFSFYPLLNRAIVYHLHHPERLPSAETEERVRREEASDRIRCRVGLTTT
jgi:glycosyltransferase involved in cell wall biosynthesis